LPAIGCVAELRSDSMGPTAYIQQT